MLVFHEVERSPALFGNGNNFLVYEIDSFRTVIDYLGTKKLAGALDVMTLENVLEIQNRRYI